MHVTETMNEGLKRQLQVTISAAELASRADERIAELKDQVRIKGFRPGKVPFAHIKRLYGRSVMAEVLEKAVNETTQRALDERNERPALRPDIKFSEEEGAIDKVIAGEADLSYDVTFEVLPSFEVVDFKTLKLERPVAEVPAAQIDEAMERLREQGVSYDVQEGRAAEARDRLTIDFEGRIDGEPFEGGSGEDMFVVIGRGGFIPGFEDGLTGAKAGEERDVKASFPDNYPAEQLRGKDAVFKVKVKDVAVPRLPELDDEFASKLGLDSLAKLRAAVEERTNAEYASATRAKLKRKLLDALNDAHTFDLPASLVDSEFEGIWRQVTQSLEQAGRTLADEGKTEEAARDEYRAIAARRVRLGLVLSDVGEKNQITVSDEELARAMVEQARRYPGEERQVYEFLRKSPEAMLQLRAPLFEDKVVDFILELAEVTDTVVTPEELLAVEDEDEQQG
ncbi:MAG: trigger factor [Rhizobiales bacterium]|nr:trigger factor [Hyphomicrobiales bacterium]